MKGDRSEVKGQRRKDKSSKLKGERSKAKRKRIKIECGSRNAEGVEGRGMKD